MGRRAKGPAGASADRRSGAVEALRAAVFDSKGATDWSTRAAAGRGDPIPEPLGPFFAKVRDESYRVGDDDISSLRTAGHSDEEIFELVVAAALGRALHGLECGLQALRGER